MNSQEGGLTPVPISARNLPRQDIKENLGACGHRSVLPDSRNGQRILAGPTSIELATRRVATVAWFLSRQAGFTPIEDGPALPGAPTSYCVARWIMLEDRHAKRESNAKVLTGSCCESCKLDVRIAQLLVGLCTQSGLLLT
jgi:hypothetical protein